MALGAAIGVFFGLLVPIAQIPLSAFAAVALRANLPAAAASTLVTNPVTFAPVYYAAWKTGDALLGSTGRPPPSLEPEPQGAADVSRLTDVWLGMTGVGKRLLLGLAIFACVFGLAVYLLIHSVWALRIRSKRRRRRSTSS